MSCICGTGDPGVQAYTNGGEKTGCLTLERDKWQPFGNHEPDVNSFPHATPVIMGNGVYIFGRNMSQFLPRGQSAWAPGPTQPPGGTFFGSCTVKISDKEFAVLGGQTDLTSRPVAIDIVFKFNTDTLQWTQLHKMTTKRSDHGCAFYSQVPNPYILIAGGRTGAGLKPEEYLSTTEIYYLKGASVNGGNLAEKRHFFNMVKTTKGKEQIYAIGGSTYGGRLCGGFLKRIEEWDPISKSWKISQISLPRKMSRFGSVAVSSSILQCGFGNKR